MRGKKKSLGVLLYVLIAVVVLGVGYAAISAIQFTINGNAIATASAPELKVKFSSDVSDIQKDSECLSNSGTIYSCATINASVVDDKNATFSVSNLKGYNDVAIIRYKIINENDGADALLNITTTLNNNTEYYSVTSDLSNASSQTLTAGSYTILTIKVRVIKVLYNSSSATANVNVTVNASII